MLIALTCLSEIVDLNLFSFNMIPWLPGIVSPPEPTVAPPCRPCPCMQIDTQGIYQLQVHCTEPHVKSGGNLWLAADRVREHFRGSVKINQRNEEISDLLAPQSFPSLRLIFMSIRHEWSSQHRSARFMERGLSPCSNYPLPLNVLNVWTLREKDMAHHYLLCSLKKKKWKERLVWARQCQVIFIHHSSN